MEHLYTNIGTLAGSLLIAYVLFRSRTSALLREELDALGKKCVRIEEESEALKKADRLKDIIIADLKAKTDLDSVKSQIAELNKQTAQESAETRLIIVGMIQTATKDLMTGFGRHVEDEREFKQLMSDNFAQVTLVLDNLERRMGVATR